MVLYKRSCSICDKVPEDCHSKTFETIAAFIQIFCQSNPVFFNLWVKTKRTKMRIILYYFIKNMMFCPKNCRRMKKRVPWWWHKVLPLSKAMRWPPWNQRLRAVRSGRRKSRPFESWCINLSVCRNYFYSHTENEYRNCSIKVIFIATRVRYNFISFYNFWFIISAKLYIFLMSNWDNFLTL